MDKQETLQKPETTAVEFYADAKQTITLGIRNLIRAFPLPIFMIESILQSVLLEYRNEAYMEYASAADEHCRRTEEYYEAKLKEMQEQHEKEKAELIQAFENPEEEPEPPVPVTTESKYINGERKVVEEVK